MRFLFLKLPLVTLPFMLQHKQRNVRCYLKSLGWLALTYACSRCPVTASSYEPGYRDQFVLGFIWEISARFPRWAEGQWSWGRVPAQRDKKSRHAKHKNYNFRAYHSFCNSWSCITAVNCDAYDAENTAGNTRRCHLGQNSSCFHPGNSAEESCGKIPSPLTEIPVGKNRDLGNRACLPSHMNTSRQR